jgi:hypothetical protein
VRTTRKQRVILFNYISRNVPDAELVRIAREYASYRELSPRLRRAHLEAMNEQRAELIRRIHAEEGAHLMINRAEFTRAVGHNGHQPSVGYFLAQILIVRGIDPESYDPNPF